MHTYKDEPTGTIFHHNGGFDGDIIIVSPDKQEVRIDSDCLLHFVFERYIKMKLMDYLDTYDLLDTFKRFVERKR